MPGMIITSTKSTVGNGIYVVGTLNSYKGVTVNNIIRIKSDGLLDTTFTTTGTGFNSSVKNLSADINKNLYVVGAFTDYNGTPTEGIIRLNSDGTKNTIFNEGTGFNSFVNVPTIDANGKIYVGGAFTSYNGVTANGIIRLNPDGTKDTAFDNSTGFDNNNSLGGTGGDADVFDINIDSNGKLYVVGRFTGYKGVAANGIIRLNPDGTKDTAFDNSTGFSSEPYTTVIDANGKIYVGGSFTSYKGVTANGIIRLNPDGTKDTAFDNSTGFDTTTVCITLDSNGKIYVGGGFLSYKGVTANGIIRLNPDGTKDTAFDNSTGFLGQFFPDVNAIEIDSNGKIYVGGAFTSYKGVTANRIIRLNPDGTKDTAFDNSTGFSEQFSNIQNILFDPRNISSPITISPTGTNRIIVTNN